MAVVHLGSRWARKDREAIRRYQGERLRRYLRDVVVPFSAFYRDLFAREGIDPDGVRSVEDLARIPFTSRADLLPTADRPARVRDFLLVPDPAVLARRPSLILRGLLRGRRRVRRSIEREFRPVLLTSTTGRSAEPTPFLYTRRDLEVLELGGARLLELCGVTREHRIVNMFPFAPHLAFWQAHYAASSGGVFCLSTGGGKTLGTQGNIRFVERIAPEALLGMPTFLYHVLHQALEEGRRLQGLRLLVLGGEKVPPGLRRKLRALAEALGSPGVRVVATYGFTEAKMAWAECPAGPAEETTGYHVPPDLGVFEVVDPATGAVLPEGSPGELVFTPLQARGTVVIRYRTGDVLDGGLTLEPCPRCGRRVPRLAGAIARTSDVRALRLGKVKGTLVDFGALEGVLDDVEHVGAWQIEIGKRGDDPMDLDRVILHVHRITDLPERDLEALLRDRLHAAAEIRPDEIRFHAAGEMRELQGVGRELKERRIVDRRPGAPSPAAAAGAPGGAS